MNNADKARADRISEQLARQRAAKEAQEKADAHRAAQLAKQAKAASKIDKSVKTKGGGG